MPMPNSMVIHTGAMGISCSTLELLRRLVWSGVSLYLQSIHAKVVTTFSLLTVLVDNSLQTYWK